MARERLDGPAPETARVPELHLAVAAARDEHQWLVRVIVHAPVVASAKCEVCVMQIVERSSC